MASDAPGRERVGFGYCRANKRNTKILVSRLPASYLVPLFAADGCRCCDSRLQMPKHLRLPRMDECQFYDRKRLEELHKKEEQLFLQAKENNQLPADLSTFEVRGILRQSTLRGREFLENVVGSWLQCLDMGVIACSAIFVEHWKAGNIPWISPVLLQCIQPPCNDSRLCRRTAEADSPGAFAVRENAVAVRGLR